MYLYQGKLDPQVAIALGNSHPVHPQSLSHVDEISSQRSRSVIP
ncbi:hypothetical protein [Phormidium pseudopriestleyi]|nr:hypothetical protein [Phormidium pseudopriestleyi]